MFSILEHCTSRPPSPPNNMKGFVSLAASSLILFFADICQWNKMSVLWVEHLCSMAAFYSLPYQSSIRPSQPPDGCDNVYVPVTREEQLTKRGCQELWKTAQVRTSFCSEWSPGIQSVKWTGIREFMSVSWVHLPASLSLPCQTEATGRGRGSCLRLRPRRIWL